MVLLLGGSGAGKTTYLNAINGYEKADAEVMLNGTNMYKQYRKMQYEVGFVPQTDMMRGKDTVLNTLPRWRPSRWSSSTRTSACDRRAGRQGRRSRPCAQTRGTHGGPFRLRRGLRRE